MSRPMRTVSFKLPPDLDEALDELARVRRTTRSDLVRQAIESLAKVGGKRLSVTTLAAELVGSVDGPSDLSTHRKHLAGYGK
jgi:Arc/MetJ-type ribon-helix-helix transcriptional regulator